MCNSYFMRIVLLLLVIISSLPVVAVSAAEFVNSFSGRG